MDEKELEALYKAMSDKFDVGNYDTFKSKMQTPDDRKRFYDAVGDQGFDLGDYNEYEKRLGGVKKKVGSIDFEKSSLQSGNTASSPSPLPSGEEGSIDPILGEVTQIKDLESKTKDIPMPSSGKGGNIVVKAPDDASIGEAKKRKENFKNIYGIDFDEFSGEIKDLPDYVYKNEGFKPDQLISIKKDNPQNYQRRIATARVQSGIRDMINKQFQDGNINEDTRKNLLSTEKINTNNYNVGDYQQQRNLVKSQAALIDEIGGENTEKLKSQLAVERAKIYGDSYKNGFDNVAKDATESKYLDNNALLGYQYIKDLSPEKAKQYERLFIDPKTLKDKPFEQAGYNHLMRTVKETGINLQLNAIDEDINNLKKIAKDNGGYLMPDQLEQLDKLSKKEDELYKQNDELDNEYPEKLFDKISDATQEILGQKMSWLDYAKGKTDLAFKHTLEGAWEMVSSPFMSDESNNMRELGIMGENIAENYIYHKTDKNKGLTTDTLVIKPELQSQIDAIVNDKSLDASQKEAKLYPLLRDNKDKFGRVPLKNSKLNVSPSSILYGVTDIGTTLLPFVALETVTGGGASAGIARKFLSTFTAAATTGFHDTYSEALMEGKSQSEAYKYAMGVTAINSFAMAGAGTPQAIRSMAGLKTSAGQIINKMTDAEIESALKNTPKAIKLFGKNIQPLIEGAANRIKSTPKMLKEGLESGAKFEGAMTAANEIKHQIYNTPIDREENFKQSILGLINFGILGAGLGHIGYKSPTELQKSSFLETGKNPNEYIEQAKLMLKDGNLSQAEFEQVKNNIETSATAYKNMPTINSKGVELSEKEKGDYLYNEAVKNEALKKQLPPRQKEKAEHTALVADFKNDYILEPKTDKQLESRKNQLEKSLEPKKDAEGKTIEPNEKEVKEAKAELEAINDIIENKPKEEVDTKLSEPIEGLDEQGVPIGDNVPSPTKPEVKTENGVSVEPPQNIPESITIKPENEIKAEVPENTIQAESEGVVNAKADEVEQPAKEESKIENSEVPSPKIFAEAKRTILSFRGLQEIATEKGLENINSRDRKSDLQLVKDAEITVNKWAEKGEYKSEVESLINKAEKREPLSDEQRIILQQHIANLREQASSLRGKEGYDTKLQELNRAVLAGKESRSAAGAALRVADYASEGKPTMEDWMVETMEASGVDRLTENQKSEIQKQFEEYEAKLKIADEKIQKLESANAKILAEKELNDVAKKTTPKSRTKTKDEFISERQSLKEKLKQEFETYKQSINKLGIKSDGGVEGFIITAKMAKIIGEIVKSHVNELGANLKEVTKKALEDVKEYLPWVTDKDINDVISGKYNEQKKTKNQLMADMRDLRDEIILTEKLDELINKKQPIREKKKIDRNKKIKELQDKIKGFKKDNPNVEEQLNTIKSRAESSIKKIEEQIKSGDFETKKPVDILKDKELQKKHPELYKEVIDARDKLLKVKEDRAIALMKDAYSKRTKAEKVGRFAGELLGIGRVVKSSFDVSMPFRQGLWGLTRELFTLPIGDNKGFKSQRQLLSQFGKMYQALGSEKLSRRIMADIHESPRYELAQESGLNIAEPTSRLSEEREDTFGPSLAERIPIIGKSIPIGKEGKRIGGFVKASERAATTFVNQMKWDIFNNFVDMLEANGKTFENSKKDYEAAAIYANKAVARGKLGKKLENANAVTSRMFFSLRLQASRLQLLTDGLNPLWYYKVPKELRIEYAKDMAKFIASGITVLAVANSLGYGVGLNPYSSDFGKVKIGNTTYDIWGGMQQFIVLFSRLLMGKTAKLGGDTEDLGNQKGQQTRLDILSKFAKSKSSPEAALFMSLMSGKNYNGKPVSIPEILTDFITPLQANDIIDVAKDASIQQIIITALLTAHGVGVQTYSSDNK